MASAPQAPEPAAAAELGERVSLALLVVLETLSPAERAVFVLREAFGMSVAEVAGVLGRSEAAVRQMSHRAREHVHARQPRFDTDRQAQREVTERFFAAVAGGDMEALLAALAPDVVLISDGGGKASAARRPITGADKVARFLLGVLAKQPTVRLAPRTTADGPALALVDGDDVTGLINLQADGDHITRVWIQWNPHKLTHWSGSGPDASPPDTGPS